MKRKTLDWSQFDWTEFEQLCIKLAEQVIPDSSFAQHLSRGHKQDGIDLLAFSKKDGSFLCIQCKEVEDFTIAHLDVILQKFKDGFYFDKTTTFIIATSFLINSSKLQNAINGLRSQWYAAYRIELDCWDRKRLEIFLKDRWDLVSEYFGLGQANDFCAHYLRRDLLDDLSEPVNFISRRIVEYDKNESEKNGFWYFVGKNNYSLAELMLEPKETTKRICLLGEAHNGKSYLLQKAAFEIKYSGKDVTPFFIQIREHTVQPLDELLQKLYKHWQKIPLRKIILFIDGVDEVPADRFDDMIIHIRDFSLAYQPVSIIFSCRKLFFHEYAVAEKIKNFETFDLCPLDIIDINHYLKARLGYLFEDFERRVENARISDLLSHPFYLNQLVEKFLPPPHELPEGKISIVDDLLNESSSEAEKRKLKGSESLRHMRPLYKKTIQKFSFALQVAGVNALSENMTQELFNADEILLLRNSPLITNNGSLWGFTNAFFQEHIAARALSVMPIEEIIALSTIGRKNRKIKPKWIQTLSSLLALLERNETLFHDIYFLFEQDNLELLFQTEPSKFDDQAKRFLLEKLLNRCIKLNNRTFIVHEETIGLFIQSSRRCKDYLLECLSDNANTELIKLICCRMLQTSNMTSEQSTRYLALVKEELKRNITGSYAGELLDTVISHKLGNEVLLKELTALAHLNVFSEYRARLFEMMQYLGLVDVFYDYGLNGILLLKQEQVQNYIGGSEHQLEKFLLSANEIQNVRKLLAAIEEQNLEDFFNYDISYRKDFFTALFEKLAALYPSHTMLIFPVASYIRHLGRKYLRDDFKQVDIFLDKTDTYGLVLRILVKEIFENGNWQIGTLITRDSYDYLLFEHEINNYEPSRLRLCMSGLRYREKGETAELFRQLCIDATEGTILNQEEESKYLAYVAAEKQKKENDLIYIQNVEAFKQGVRNYFKEYGKNTLPVEDVYVHIEGEWSEIRKNADSHFLWEFFVNWQKHKKVVHLQNCLTQLDDQLFFETFQAEEIMDYQFRNPEADAVLLPILKGYYYKNLPLADFTNSYWKDSEGSKYKMVEVRLGNIFLAFEFDTPVEKLLEFIWLDKNGTRGFKTASLNKRKTIAQLVLEKLDSRGKQLLRKKIVANLNLGIKNESVLGTHLELCRELKIKEAVEVMLTVIKNSDEEHYIKSDGVEIYLELGGDIEELLPVYQQQSKYGYFFLHLLGKLSSRYYDEVLQQALRAIHNPATTELYRTPILQILTEAGCVEAFEIIVNEFIENKIASRSYSRNYKITHLTTDIVLSGISKIAFVLVDPAYNYRRSDESLRSIVLDWLFAMAKRSEEDLDKVLTFFEESKLKLAETYNDMSDLNWYENRALEEFRKSAVNPFSVVEIKNWLKAADY